MMKKQGITVVMMVITVVILTILTGTITYSMYSTINYSRLNTWANEIAYIQDVVNEQMNSTSAFADMSQTVTIDVSSLSQTQINKQFEGETITADNTVELQVLDLGTLKITDTVYGRLETITDVYAVSITTGRVYYVEGIKVDGTMYYTLTDNLQNKFSIVSTNNILSSIVFMPDKIGYTNEPVKVIVKVPSTFTNITVTTSNTNITVGTQTINNDVYEYIVNENEIIGNYIVTVTYNNGVEAATENYEVNGYDVKAPVISPILYENMVYKETDVVVSDYITNVTATDESGIKYLKYTLGTITEDNAKEYFKENGNNVVDGKINLNRDTTIYTIYAEDVAGNFAVLTFDKKDIMPDDWSASVSYIEDRVPIPKGFVASPYTDENKKDNGMVIYALNETEISNGTRDISKVDSSYQYSLENRNQFVWIPVDSGSFETLFRRYEYLNEKILNTFGGDGGFWEVILESNNMPADSTKNTSDYVSTKTLQEATAMYASVKKYGGFFVARYEVGADATTVHASFGHIGRGNLSVTMSKYPYAHASWGSTMANEEASGGAVTVSRSFYPASDTKYGVVSTLMYGVQWDRMVTWFKEKNPNLNLEESTNYGVYYDEIISSSDLNPNAKYSIWENAYSEWKSAADGKTVASYWLGTTGAYKNAKICNVYDTAGSLFEWTMEGRYTNNHALRGGAFSYYGSHGNLICRGNSSVVNATYDFGFRPALYIK